LPAGKTVSLAQVWRAAECWQVHEHCKTREIFQRLYLGALMAFLMSSEGKLNIK
jgi:hypothetical protein